MMNLPTQSTTDLIWSRRQGKAGKVLQRVHFNPAETALKFAWNSHRLHNMILAVGESTPAGRLCGTDRRLAYQEEEDSEDDDNDDSSSNREVADIDPGDIDSQTMGDQTDQSQGEGSGQPDPNEINRGHSEESDSESDSTDVPMVLTRPTIEHRRAPFVSQRSWVPLIRHESCINTACWLDTPWRLSVDAPRESATVESWETPTQLITSGDDHMVKFWDVTYSMGSTSPVSGGWDVFTPFLTPLLPSSTNLSARNDYRTDRIPPGAVIPLASISSGHLGNVFHVTPVPATPGLVLSCGADGQLRSCHVEREHSSNLVMLPSLSSDDSDDEGYYTFRAGLAYSHQLLTDATGLLCSDRGLFRFDLRVAPRSQPRQSFKLSPSRRNGWRSYVSKIKACAVWSPSLGKDTMKQSPSLDSNYVFAGGVGEEVHLFDLRMDNPGEGSNRVVERYRPRALKDSESASVSGIDVSRDGRELLVSYESDQIYTFPVFGEASSCGNPLLAEIDQWSRRYMDDPDQAVPDLACYGAHLNRFTFLKSARYAGPNDDYICTGSDSGHAWIYRKSDGAVVSLLSADSHVCNGIVPHPTLPFFVSYGIDSVARVWRATLPVETDPDELSMSCGVVACSRPYQMSPVVKNPEQVQRRLVLFEDAPVDISVFPDYIPTTQEVLCSGRFMPNMLWAMVDGSNTAPRIGNALRTLPFLLRSNRYEVCKAVKSERESPIEGPLDDLSLRISRMRLQHQAAQWDLVIHNSNYPYLWSFRDNSKPCHLSDLVPDFPSDWIQWDPNMDQMGPQPPKVGECTSAVSQRPKLLSNYPWLGGTKEEDETFWWPVQSNIEDESAQSSSFSSEDIEFSRKVLYYTALLCKDGGNEAMKNSDYEAAARRYDKAIQYCAVAFFSYSGSSTHVPHLVRGMSIRVPVVDGDVEHRVGYVYTWCPLLRLWISCHLNLALLLLKPDLSRFQGDARNQAEIALRLLAPYTKEAGKVYHDDHLLSESEPHKTYAEARKLEAKAFFRLGSAELEMGDFVSAVKSLESSISATDGPIDPLVQKRLAKAKTRSCSQKKRNRRRFELALSSNQPTAENTDS